MKIFLFVLMATVFEAVGDAIVRSALSQGNARARVVLFLLGSICLTLYGTSLNLAPVEFAQVVGFYIAMLFITFQITNYAFFGVIPTVPVFAGGTLVIAGGLIIGLWK